LCLINYLLRRNYVYIDVNIVPQPRTSIQHVENSPTIPSMIIVVCYLNRHGNADLRECPVALRDRQILRGLLGLLLQWNRVEFCTLDHDWSVLL